MTTNSTTTRGISGGGPASDCPTPNHPFRTGEELQRLRARVSDPRFAAAWAGIKDTATAAVAEWAMPLDRAAGWGHDFYCPTHSVPLAYRPGEPSAHWCAAGDHELVGEKFDGGWRTVHNGRILRGCRAEALSWLATGDRQWLEHPRAVLLDWAARYPALPALGTHQGQAKVEGISLAEAVWAMSCAQIHADIADGLDHAERAAIEELLAQAGAFLVTQLMGKLHNIECWHLAALASVAAVLDDDALLQVAVDSEYGLLRQFDSGIRADGWWTEGSPHYHFYMLQPVLSAALALRGRRDDVVQSPRLREMTLAPLRLLRHDLSLPAFNDGWDDLTFDHGLAGMADRYERAWALWAQPEVRAVLRHLYADGRPRDSEGAMSYGPDLPSDPSTDVARRVGLPPIAAVHPASGYAVLHDEPGAERALFAVLKFGPHGGGHGHPDKLQLDVHAHGVRIAPDLGSPAYNSPLQGPWIRQTLSHNTATIGGGSQPMAAGRLIDQINGPEGWQLVDAFVDWPERPEDLVTEGSWLAEEKVGLSAAYAGAAMRRLVLTGPARPYVVDILTVRQPTDARIDVAWRQPGEAVDADQLPPADFTALTSTQQQLRDPRSLPTGRWSVTWLHDGVRSRLWADDPNGSTSVLTRCPGVRVAEEQRLALRSSSAREATFASVVEFAPQEQPGLSDVVVTRGVGSIDVLVEGPDFTDLITVVEAPAATTDRVEVDRPVPTDRQLRVTVPVATGPQSIVPRG